jgi:hypothetical protein
MSRWAKAERVMHRKTHQTGTVVGNRDDISGAEVLWDGESTPRIVWIGLLKEDPTRYGFQYGPAAVTRAARGPKGHVVVRITTDAGVMLDIQVSPTGRSVRVHRHAPRPKELT